VLVSRKKQTEKSALKDTQKREGVYLTQKKTPINETVSLPKPVLTNFKKIFEDNENSDEKIQKYSKHATLCISLFKQCFNEVFEQNKNYLTDYREIQDILFIEDLQKYKDVNNFINYFKNYSCLKNSFLNYEVEIERLHKTNILIQEGGYDDDLKKQIKDIYDQTTKEIMNFFINEKKNVDAEALKFYRTNKMLKNEAVGINENDINKEVLNEAEPSTE